MVLQGLESTLDPRLTVEPSVPIVDRNVSKRLSYLGWSSRPSEGSYHHQFRETCAGCGVRGFASLELEHSSKTSDMHHDD